MTKKEPSAIEELDEEQIKQNEANKPPKSLSELIDYLDDANCHPEDSLKHLSALASSCDDVVLKLELVEQFFAPGKSEGETVEMIESFM